MSRKRVVFEFDERSVKTLEEMKEIGLSQNTQNTDAEDRLAARLHREAYVESLQAQVAQLRRDLGAAESARVEAEREGYRRGLVEAVRIAEANAMTLKIADVYHPTDAERQILSGVNVALFPIKTELMRLAADTRGEGNPDHA